MCQKKKNTQFFFFYSTICKKIFAKCSFLFWWLGNGAEMYLLDAVLPERRDPTVQSAWIHREFWGGG